MSKSTKQLTEGYQAELKKADGKNYFDRVAEDRNNHPLGYSKYNSSLQEGLDTAKQTVKEARDFSHPNHEKSLDTWQNKFNQDIDALRTHCVSDAIKKNGAKRLNSKNSEYESKILSAFKPGSGNMDDGACVDKYRAFMKLKHAAVGYEGDGEAVDQFFSDNLLSTFPEFSQAAFDMINKHRPEYTAEYKPLDGPQRMAEKKDQQKSEQISNVTHMAGHMGKLTAKAIEDSKLRDY